MGIHIVVLALAGVCVGALGQLPSCEWQAAYETNEQVFQHS